MAMPLSDPIDRKAIGAPDSDMLASMDYLLRTLTMVRGVLNRLRIESGAAAAVVRGGLGEVVA